MKKSIYLFALLFSASIIFTACDRDEPVASVSLNHSTLTLIVGESQRLIATILPADATNQNVRWTSSDEAVATVDDNGLVTAVSLGTATITAQAGSQTAVCEIIVYDRYNAVGVVINGVRWATRNVDAPGTFADNPQDAGMLYQWNRRIGWSSTNPMTDSNGNTTWDSSIPAGTAWYAENDPCPAGWRVPTQAELTNLRNQPNIWVSNWNDTGINGRLFGTAPNQIFLPAAGNRYIGGWLNSVGTIGDYWSSTQVGRNAMVLWFTSTHSGANDIDRTNGFSVRCVADN